MQQNVDGKRLKGIPDEKLEDFYKYQWFKCNLQEISMEWDSLVVLAEHNLVINIEVKSGPKLSVIKKAAKQTKKHFSLFRRIFGTHLSEEWNFVKAVFAPNFASSNQNEPCTYCLQFLLTENDIVDLLPWIKRITDQFISPIKTISDEEYQNLLVGIIGFTVTRNANKLTTLIHNPFEVSQTMEIALTAKSSGIDGESPMDRNILKKVVEGDTSDYKHLCYMLTSEQINAIKSQASFLIIDGDYGTGKTFVLKERTMMFAAKSPGCKIAYITLSGMKSDKQQIVLRENSSLMDYIAIKDFDNISNVDVITFNDLVQLAPTLHLKSLFTIVNDYQHRGSYSLVEMKDLIQSSLKYKIYDFIFIDESPLINIELKCVSITVALKSKLSNRKWKDEMIEKKKAVAITLQHNMRNTENILNFTKGFIPKSPFRRSQEVIHRDKKGITLKLPQKNLVGPLCYHYSNITKLDDISLAKAVINKYFSSNPEETAVFLCQGYLDVLDVMVEELHKSFSHTHRIINFGDNSTEMESFIRDPTGILLTNYYNFHGAGARNTVIFLTEFIEGQVVYSVFRNAIMRTMSFTIIITNEEQDYSPAAGVAEDSDLHQYIHANCSKPKCHYIEMQPEFDAKYLADQLLNKFIKSDGTILILVRYSKDAKRLRNVFRKKIAVKKKIIIVTYREGYIKGRHYGLRLMTYLKMRSSIVITRIIPFSNEVLNIQSTSLISTLAIYVIILESGDCQIQPESYNLRNMCLNTKSKIAVVGTGSLDLYRQFFEMVNISEIVSEN